MKVLGNRVYLSLPLLPDSKIELSAADRKQVQEEMFAKFDRLTVFAIGDTVNATGVASTIEREVMVKPGDEVFVDSAALRHAIFVDIEGAKKAIVPYNSIQHVW